MAVNRGKQFEKIIFNSLKILSNVSVDRFYDQTSGFKGSTNICDFVVYRKPIQCYIECKTVHGKSLPFKNITDTQWHGLLRKSYIDGVTAGILCWWVDRDVTKFIPIQYLEMLKKNYGKKSLAYDYTYFGYDFCIELNGTKKRTFYSYDMENFLDELQNKQ